MKINFSTSQLLRLAGCMVFDVAMIIAFIKLFALFVLLEPFNSFMMLGVLLASLLISNGVIIFAGQIYKKFGIVYATTIVVAVLGYTVIANIVSIITIAGSVVSYMVWQLMLLACLLVFLSVISFFAKKFSNDGHSEELEQDMKQIIAVQLMNIESQLYSKQAQAGGARLLRSFKELKERMQASTPFGRMINNRQALEIENAVQGNLEYIYLQTKREITEEVVEDISQLLEETLRLIINREILLIK